MEQSIVINNIKAVAGKTLPANSSLLLYGSRARGDNRSDSDWDLLILLDKPSLSFKDYDYGYPFSELGWEIDEYTAEPTLLCNSDVADDALADTRQSANLSDAGTERFQLADDCVALVFFIVL